MQSASFHAGGAKSFDTPDGFGIYLDTSKRQILKIFYQRRPGPVGIPRQHFASDCSLSPLLLNVRQHGPEFTDGYNPVKPNKNQEVFLCGHQEALNGPEWANDHSPGYQPGVFMKICISKSHYTNCRIRTI
jgi:hypothetical protein